MSTLKTNSIEPVTHSDPLVFRTNATETMRLATDGSLLLGIQSSPGANTIIAGQKSANDAVLSRLYNPNTGTSALVALQLNNNVNNGYVVNYGQNHSSFPKTVSLENDNGGNGLLLWSGSAAGPIRFCAGSGAERMRITSNGNVGIGNSIPGASLDVNGTIRASSGIQFGTDTSAANTLSDYEEGSYTATVTYSTTLTNITPSTTVTVTGYYVKIGKLVTVSVPSITRDTTFNGNTVIISTISLPFASGNYKEVGTVGGYRVRGQYSSNVANYGEYMFASVLAGGSSVATVRMLSNTASGDNYYLMLDRTSSEISMTLTYRTA